MKVILLDNIKGIGRMGEVKDVNDGYAKNFLFPRKLGKPATLRLVRDANARAQQRIAASDASRDQLREVSKRVQGIVVTIHAKSNEKGTLFSSITPEMIVQHIGDAASAHIPPSSLVSHEHLKHTGQHTIELKLAPDIQATCTLEILPLK